MRAMVDLDEQLLARAQDLTGLFDCGAVLQEALRALIAREAARRLALLAGSAPKTADVPRRRAKRLR